MGDTLINPTVGGTLRVEGGRLAGDQSGGPRR
ncbi:hypothetical protein HNQ10_000748 [Deinococcus metallilatus]|uniref:Uncharacterized protein n=1 Tax=Deinococcus metallilatus TaxID=1211322 RepID=A0ABR6MRE7_9DEIO|nr:hypothetical protein [Deinococcus metallilatus]